MSGSNDETTYEQVRSLAARWYFDEVRSVAAEIERKCKAREYDSSEEAHDDISQTIDGHEFIIYTGQAQLVCFASNHDDECEEETGEKPKSVEVQAYYAMKRDVYEAIDATLIDALDEEPDDESEDEADEERDAQEDSDDAKGGA